MKFNDNIIVNSLWIGDELSAIELLTLHSFIDKGHHFKLWLYEPLKTPLPREVEIRDASEILPKEKIFVYKNKNSFGHGKGSVAGFSDIFRYKLLYEKGGWWVDMDVTCLKALDFEEPYYFREHHDLLLVGNVMKCPVHSELMSRCYEEASLGVNETNIDWHKPIDILNDHVSKLGLKQYIRSGHSNIDRWEKTNRFILTANVPPEEWYFIHWQNEEWKYRHLSKTSFYYRSFLAKKLQEYKLLQMPSTYPARLANNISRQYNWIINLSSYIIPMLEFK